MAWITCAVNPFGDRLFQRNRPCSNAFTHKRQEAHRTPYTTHVACTFMLVIAESEGEVVPD